MTPALRVVSPGLLTTIQDRGRTGYQHLGVPVSGALDMVALAAANALVNNRPEEAALEIFYRGPVLAVEAHSVRLAIVGGEAQIERLSDPAARNGQRVETMRSLTLRRGEAIRIGSISNGACCYLAIEGGLALCPVLGSLSTDIRSRIGGIEGRALAEGDLLPLRGADASPAPELTLGSLAFATPSRVRIVPGPQRDFFSDAEFQAFTDSTYIVGTNSNRMGLRLTGRPIVHSRGANIVSDSVAPGSVQIPGDGQPIVLLADRQTTGGYPKIATVISADIPALGRLKAGASIAFQPVTLEQAVEARRQLLADIKALASSAIALPTTPSDLMPRLLECNLISGVFDAAA